MRLPSVLLGVAAGGAAAALLRRRARPAERVERRLADGSTVTLPAGTPDGDRILAAARAGLEAARGS